MESSVHSFVKAKSRSEIGGFGEGVDGRHKVRGLRQKEEVRINEGDGIDRKGACVG